MNEHNPVPAFITQSEQPVQNETQVTGTPAPAEAPKKNNKMTILLVILLVVIAILVGVIIFLLNNESQKQTTVTTTTNTATVNSRNYDDDEDDESKKSDGDLAAETINLGIHNDVSSVITALTSYQANNRGVIPTIQISNGNETGVEKMKTWQYFIDTYLDSDYNGQPTHFTDTYKINVCNYFEGTCKKPSNLTWDEDKYVIYIATKATCDNSTNEVKVSEGARRVAVYTVKKPYSNMTNKYFCLNN